MASDKRNESNDIFERAQHPLAESIACPFPKITDDDEYIGVQRQEDKES